MRAGITYAALGQFRVLTVQEDIHCPPLVLDTPDAVVDAWMALVTTQPWYDPNKEHMVVFVLNTRLVLMGWNVVSIGTANETFCHPREVLRPVLVSAGSSFALAHNHPSGCVNPSDADRRATVRLCEGAELLQLGMVDHVIISSGKDRFSFREAGMMPWAGRQS